MALPLPSLTSKNVCQNSDGKMGKNVRSLVELLHLSLWKMEKLENLAVPTVLFVIALLWLLNRLLEFSIAVPAPILRLLCALSFNICRFGALKQTFPIALCWVCPLLAFGFLVCTFHMHF